MAMTLTDTADLLKITRQGVYLAIKQGRLKASQQENRRWIINVNDLNPFQINKHTRQFIDKDGSRYIDPKQGTYSISQAAKHLKVDTQKIYYAIYSGKIPSYKKYCSWILKKEDLDNYKRIYLSKRRRKVKKAA